jgi:hypothetical protein
MLTRAGKSTGWRSRFAGWTTDTLENAKEGVYPIRNRVLDLDFLLTSRATDQESQPEILF